jgi:hypothetical protein
MERRVLGSGRVQDDTQVCSVPGRMKRKVICDGKRIESDECMWVWDMKSPVVVQGEHRGGRMGQISVREFWEGKQMGMG